MSQSHDDQLAMADDTMDLDLPAHVLTKSTSISVGLGRRYSEVVVQIEIYGEGMDSAFANMRRLEAERLITMLQAAISAMDGLEKKEPE